MPPWPRARAGISHCPWSPAPVAFRPLCLVARLSERQRVAAPIVSSLAKYLTRYAVYARRLAFSLFPRVPSSEIAAVGRSGRRTAAGPNGASSDAQGDAPVGQGRALPDRHRPAIGTSGARRGRTRPSQRGQGRSDPEQYDIVYVTPFFFLSPPVRGLPARASVAEAAPRRALGPHCMQIVREVTAAVSCQKKPASVVVFFCVSVASEPRRKEPPRRSPGSATAGPQCPSIRATGRVGLRMAPAFDSAAVSWSGLILGRTERRYRPCGNRRKGPKRPGRGVTSGHVYRGDTRTNPERRN